MSADGAETLAALSRLIGRNDAYLQQYLRRGTPRVLAEVDRQRLARYFGVDEAELGGPERVPTDSVWVPRLDAVAAAGAGGVVESERVIDALPFSPRQLRALGLASGRPTLIEAIGDSMAPLILDRDTIMVDASVRRVGRTRAIHVLRLDGAVVVKHVRAAGDRLHITSENPDAPAIGWRAAGEVEVLGRVVWLGRALR